MNGDPPPIVDSGIRCVRCGYNLSGAALGGYCPECGLPVGHSLARLGPARQPDNEADNKATASLALGIVSFFGCLMYGVPGIICAILAIVFANQAHNAAPSGPRSAAILSRANTGRTCGIISLSLVGVVVLVVIVIILVAAANP